MGKRLQRFGEVRIIDEMNGFGLDFVKKTVYGAKLVVFYYCPGQACTCPDLPGPQGF